MAENRAPKWLKHCDTEEKATLKGSRTEDEEEAPATKMHLLPLAGPDLEEDSASSNSNKFDVFISHRGPDTKRTFAIHLYDLLWEKGIQAFLDKEELHSGKTVWNAVKEAIAFSKVDVCILSSGYAESPWCLKELEMMLHKYNINKSKLIPVFYDVKPTHVRHLQGTFGQGFKKLIDKGQSSKEVSNEEIDNWQQALRKIADIKGHEGQGELCSKIVDEVREKLDFALVAAPGMVGRERELQSAINEIMRLREEGLGLTSVEISGMGGIGKTTFAKNLYSRICSKFHKHCFIENVEGLVEKGGIDAVHKQLVNGLFRCPDTWNAKQYLTKHLHNMEILVVLDNISGEDLSSTVFIEHDVCLSIKSAIVVTTREEGILEHEPKFAKYCQNLLSLRMSKLDFETSKQIFCEYAFGGMKRNSSEWNDLIDSFVKKCDGIPLALAVHGRIVYGRDGQHWKIVWDKIKDFLHPDLMQTLKFSYDNLNDELSKRMFLDVAIFFRFEKADLLVQLRDRYVANESEVLYAVDMLKRKLLIQVEDGVLYMHDLLVDLARSIVKEEDPRPGHRSCLWHPNDVENVLSGETGTEKVTALSLVSNGSAVLDECGDPWCAEAFSKLPSLEFLILDGPCIEGNDFSKLSKRLLWLKWTNFPYEHFPETLCIKRVRVLQLSGERLTWLWECPAQEIPAKLRELSLSNCKNLQRLPELKERFLHLSCLILDGCTSLVTLPNSFGRLHGLKHLQLIHCKALERLPDTFGDLRNLCNLKMKLLKGLKSLAESFGELSRLESLTIEDCNALQRLAKSFGNLLQLKSLKMLNCGALQHLPKSFGNLLRLERLDMSMCRALKSLPESFGNLLRLERLNMFYCRALQTLPESFGRLSQLREFIIDFCQGLLRLPESFGNLVQLKILKFGNCVALECLPKSFGNLSLVEDLHLVNLSALECLPGSFGNLLSLERLKIEECNALHQLPESFGNLLQLKSLEMIKCNALQRLPEAFGNLSLVTNLYMSNLEALQCLPESFGNLSLIKNLYMSNLEALQCLPESFGNLSRLETLSIIRCRALQCLSESLGNLSCIKWLDIKLEALQCLPESFGELLSLERLEIEECNALQGLPESFGNLSRLERLNMRSCNALQHLPQSFDKLSQLKSLVMNECNALQPLPKSFGNLSCLEILEINKCSSLQCLPESFGNLLQLKSLTIKNCKALQCQPESFTHLQQLQKLLIKDLFDLARVLETFGCFTNLLHLSIFSCTGMEGLPESFGGMEGLPESFGHLPQLQLLGIFNCSDLKWLPKSFGHLPRLQYLEIIACNGLEGLPESFGHLSQLQHLTISHCSGLKGLPKSFECLTKLVKLEVNHCNKIKLLAEQFQRLLRIHDLSIMENAYSSFGQNGAVGQQNIDCWKKSTWHGQDTQHQHLISLVHEVTRGIQAYSKHAAPSPFSDVELIANHFSEELLQSLGASQHIKRLHLHHCHSLQKLPDIIGSLSRLTELDLNSCLNLKVLPACIENLSGLKNLSLISCWNLEELPDTIGNLKNLEDLYVSDCIVLKGFAFQSGSFSNLICFTVEHCWMVEVLDIHALVRLGWFIVVGCVNLKSIAGLSGLPKLTEIRIQGCLNLKDIVPGDINGCAILRSMNRLEISGCYQLRPPREGLVQQPPHDLEKLHLSFSHDILSSVSLDNKTKTMPASLIYWSLNAKTNLPKWVLNAIARDFRPSRVVNAKTNPALFPVVEQRVTHLLSTKHDSFSSSTSSFIFHKFSHLRAHSSSSLTSSFSFHKFSHLHACSSSSSTSSFSFHKFSHLRARSSSSSTSSFFCHICGQHGACSSSSSTSSFSCLSLIPNNIKDGVGILCFVSVVGSVDSPMHVPPPQTVFSMKAQGDSFDVHVVQSKSSDFGEEIHMATFRYCPWFDVKHMYIEVQKGTDYWPSYEAIVKEGWIILLPGGQGEKGNEQNELLATEILNIFYSELRKQRFMSRAWTQLPSQLRIFEFSALDIAGCQITKASRHCNTCIMEEETGLTWERKLCLFVDDHALLLQHSRGSSKHSFLAYPGLHRNLEGGGVLANLYKMSICMLVKGKVVRSTKLQEIIGINQEEIPSDLNTLLQTKASCSTFETLHRKRTEMLHGGAYTSFSFGDPNVGSPSWAWLID